MKKLLIAAVLFLSVAPLHAAIKAETVIYKEGDTVLKGYIAYDDAIQGKRPGVIVVPDWWGLGEFPKDRARALARQGFTAMVMDMYGNGLSVEPPDQAKQLMNTFTANPMTMEVRFDATHKTLVKHKTVDPQQVAAIGYSLGGLVVLEMARRGKDLNSVASIWGVISKTENPAKKGKVKASILVQQPEKDGWAPMEAVNSLKSEMKAAGAKASVVVYPGTVHGFSRHDATTRAMKYKLGIRFNEGAERQSWKDLNRFLKVSFKDK